MKRTAENPSRAHARPCVGVLLVLALALTLLAALPLAAASSDEAALDAANKFYEQGKFREAAAAYEQIARAGSRSGALHYNLGNAWYKAGQVGRAIAAYRQAERFSPRDPDLQNNLQFVRKKVTGAEPTLASAWQRALSSLTLNEWTLLASAALWAWFILLALREARPAWRGSLSGYTATVGVLAAMLIGFTAAARSQRETRAAVVIVSEAIARSGPLDEAKVLHQFRDGTELLVIDQKEVALAGQKQMWLQIEDSSKHMGWIKIDQVVLIESTTH